MEAEWRGQRVCLLHLHVVNLKIPLYNSCLGGLCYKKSSPMLEDYPYVTNELTREGDRSRNFSTSSS